MSRRGGLSTVRFRVRLDVAGAPERLVKLYVSPHVGDQFVVYSLRDELPTMTYHQAQELRRQIEGRGGRVVVEAVVGRPATSVG